MFSKALAALVAATNLLTANAHMFISSPSPIPASAPKEPLDASGSNFPCHGATLPSSGGMEMAAGSSQLLAWDTGDGANTAVHGGGSCQMTITYESDAEKVKDPKNWYVIYSIEGGCPTNSAGNLDGSYQGPQGSYSGSYDCTDPKTNGVDCVNQFNFTIPKGVKSGHAIMAWTWYNNIGNRELYMNCINTQLTGGDGSEMNDFPSMFVANVAVDSSGRTCPTTEGVNVQFPFPGKYVTTVTLSGPATAVGSGTNYPLAKPTGAGCQDDGAPASGSGGSETASSSPSPSSSYAAPSASQVPLSTSSTAGTAPSFSYVPLPTASGSGSSSGGSCPAGQVPCANLGTMYCIGDYQYGLCNIGNCMIPQALAAGTRCVDGQISKRSHIRHGVRRHRGALRW